MAKVNNNIFKDVDIRKLKINHTPVGEAAALFVITPSTQFDDDGQYFIKIKFKTDSKECKKLKALIDEARDEAFKMAQDLLESPKEKKNLKMAEPSYKAEEDDEGNETGYTTFNFKRKAIRTTKNGDVKPVHLPLFDSMLQPVDPEGLELWNGSEISVAFRLCPYYTERIGVGVSHRIEAVQIMKAVTGGGNYKAEDFGFQQGKGFVSHTPDEDEDEEADDINQAKPATGDEGDF